MDKFSDLLVVGQVDFSDLVMPCPLSRYCMSDLFDLGDLEVRSHSPNLITSPLEINA